MGTLHRAKHASVTEIWYGGKAMWALRITKMQWNSICTGFDTSGCSIPDYFSSVEVISSSNPNLQNFSEAHVCQDSRALEMFSINRLASFPNKKKMTRNWATALNRWHNQWHKSARRLHEIWLPHKASTACNPDEWQQNIHPPKSLPGFRRILFSRYTVLPCLQ